MNADVFIRGLSALFSDVIQIRSTTIRQPELANRVKVREVK
ncbi:MAG: hypothetical protein U7126_25965 [Microcoleus sp.]